MFETLCREQHGEAAAGGMKSEGCSPSQQERGQSSSPEKDPLADQVSLIRTCTHIWCMIRASMHP